jgi:hypothetical protein
VTYDVVGVLKLFALLFSNQWIKQWQSQDQRRVGPKGEGSRPTFYERIFSLRVTLWYLIYQRLNADPTEAAVVVNLRDGGANRLGRRGAKSLSSRVISAQTSGYDQARQRLPLELLQKALERLGLDLCKLVGWVAKGKTKPEPGQRVRQLLDGSTISILQTPSLAADYPPACNKSGSSDWCVLRIVVGFCARSGAVLSAIEGALHQSEQALTWILMERASPFTIWIGDRNFGVWSVVAQAQRYHQNVVVRMTQARAAKLAGGRPLHSGEDRPVTWHPSRQDKSAAGTERSAVEGRLIYVRLQKDGKWIDLWLFTTLDAQDYPLDLLVKWYGQRWQAELHFRSVKTEMTMAELHVCSPQMARKEFYAGLLAYSLVRAVLWAAGERLEERVQTLSFSQARRILLERLKTWGLVELKACDLTSWAQALLEEVAKQTLPKRKKERPSEIRRVRHRRQHFPPLKGSRAEARARDLSPKS